MRRICSGVIGFTGIPLERRARGGVTGRSAMASAWSACAVLCGPSSSGTLDEETPATGRRNVKINDVRGGYGTLPVVGPGCVLVDLSTSLINRLVTCRWSAARLGTHEARRPQKESFAGLTDFTTDLRSRQTTTIHPPTLIHYRSSTWLSERSPFLPNCNTSTPLTPIQQEIVKGQEGPEEEDRPVRAQGVVLHQGPVHIRHPRVRFRRLETSGGSLG